MDAAGGDVGDSFASERTTGDGDGCCRVDGGAVTELPIRVVAPAGDGTVRQHGTRMGDAGGDVGDSFTGESIISDGDGCCRVDGGAVTELPELIGTPAGDCAVR